MHKFIIAGIGTDVGKTVVSGVFMHLTNGDYWKPIQSGKTNSDTEQMQNWFYGKRIHPPAYSLKEPLSPHHAARLENITISTDCISLPMINRPLIIESVGGIFVPLTPKILSIDLFQSWQCRWFIVSRHYLGSINHTLLTIEVLKQRKIPIAGIIFNGEPNPDSEEAILNNSGIVHLGSLFPEDNINSQTFQRYAKLWQPTFSKVIQ